MWILLAVLTAVFSAGREALMKVAMEDDDEFALVFLIGIITAILLAPAAAIAGIPELNRTFWLALAGSGCINAIALVLIARAVHRSDLSLVSPLKSLTPLFMLLTAPLILAEFPNAQGLLGVVVIVAGTYLLNVRERGRGALAPFRALLRDPGARLMLLVAFLYSISASLDKVGVVNSTPLFWGAAIHLFIALAVLPRALPALGRSFKGSVENGSAGKEPAENRPAEASGSPADRPGGWRWRRWGWITAAGVATALTIAAQMTALTLTLAAYVIAIKRTSILFAVLAGHLFFGERSLKERLAGASIMLCGFLLITLA